MTFSDEQDIFFRKKSQINLMEKKARRASCTQKFILVYKDLVEVMKITHIIILSIETLPQNGQLLFGWCQ